MMKHIAGIMGIVQDKCLRNKDEALDEETLVIIEAQVKALAEELTHSNGDWRLENLRQKAPSCCRRPLDRVKFRRINKKKKEIYSSEH
jgi:hypothetical protein